MTTLTILNSLGIHTIFGLMALLFAGGIITCLAVAVGCGVNR